MNNLKNIILSKRNECHIVKISENSDRMLDFVASLLNKNVKFVQLKKAVCSRDFYEISLKIKQLCALYDAILIIEDRIDVAKLISADGVYLDSQSIDINSAKKIIDDNLIIGSDNNFCADYLISNNEDNSILTYVVNSPDAKYRAIYEELK